MLLGKRASYYTVFYQASRLRDGLSSQSTLNSETFTRIKSQSSAGKPGLQAPHACLAHKEIGTVVNKRALTEPHSSSVSYSKNLQDAKAMLPLFYRIGIHFILSVCKQLYFMKL